MDTETAPSDDATQRHDPGADDAGSSVPTANAPTVAPVPATRPDPSAMGRLDKMPIKMLNDRILVRMNGSEGERRSGGGILIPATAQMGKRLTWAEVVAVGPNVRSVEESDQVLFNPEDRYEVEVQGEDLIILRERDIHAVAAPRLAEGSTGLYL